jgi:hypothetical protein
MKNLFAISSFFLLVLISACSDEKIKPSDDVTSREYEIREVNRLLVSTAFSVEVYFDEQNSVEIITNDNLHDKIEVITRENDLVIKVQDNLNIKGSSTLRAIIRTTGFDRFFASGASSINVVDSIKVDFFDLSLSGASSFSGTVLATSSDIDISGASFADIDGSIKSLNLDVSGASNIVDTDFTVGTLQAVLSGVSTARLHISDELNINLSGASTFRYSGNPILGDVIVTDASTLEKL